MVPCPAAPQVSKKWVSALRQFLHNVAHIRPTRFEETKKKGEKRKRKRKKMDGEMVVGVGVGVGLRRKKSVFLKYFLIVNFTKLHVL